MEAVRVISPELVLVDWGPMTLSISAWLDGRARPVMAALGARRALACLTALSDFQRYLKKRADELTLMHSLPRTVARCLAAAQAVAGELTPLAAVAGAVADEVADYTVAQGADRVIVNNGGDIALRLAPGQKARVGLRAPQEDGLPRPELSGVLKVDAGSGIGGVASSGWAGRSLSPGVADLVTVWAKSAALADAAATWIAGRTDADGSVACRALAETVDPATDLSGTQVTTSVPAMSFEAKRRALTAGLQTAQNLVASGAILGCRLELQGAEALMDGKGAAAFETADERRLRTPHLQAGCSASAC